ncbi:hypothetical protein DWB77_00309 [Streptomyces hundungensis]|uniref:Uncharacterized protein n=1 Tax=Streptomyces hundungensis TaxID=1077946 RepID=A0A387HBV3_9ACTN|nr:hypothetical protein DWB77_00309 [Streptomyces hundungensis]
MVKWPARSPRWRAGRLLISAGSVVWKSSYGKQEVALPTDLLQTGFRSPSLREAVAINPGSRIAECDSSDGEVLIAVMPSELDHVVTALDKA